ncbi:hypothetical protein F5882DRAFT_466077 [Hyaloscypha sp. PMI_1271]|nr:hypothetical protein F5882DRAFT_466077 [Hyaloscypha sp. PMI_1271]
MDWVSYKYPKGYLSNGVREGDSGEGCMSSPPIPYATKRCADSIESSRRKRSRVESGLASIHSTSAQKSVCGSFFNGSETGDQSSEKNEKLSWREFLRKRRTGKGSHNQVVYAEKNVVQKVDPIAESAPENYVIEKFLADRLTSEGLEILVKWERYDKQDSTWEP